jgi:hypothetical protein
LLASLLGHFCNLCVSVGSINIRLYGGAASSRDEYRIIANRRSLRPGLVATGFFTIWVQKLEAFRKNVRRLPA